MEEQEEVRLLDELGMKPDYVKLELNEEHTLTDRLNAATRNQNIRIETP